MARQEAVRLKNEADRAFASHQVFWDVRMRDPDLYLYARKGPRDGCRAHQWIGSES